MKFVVSTRPGEPVETERPDRVVHRYTAPDGRKVVVVRDARGRLLPGARLVLLRDAGGREPQTAYSLTRRALGLPTRFTEHARRKREGKNDA
ncbi:MAG: hypothetical protein LC121_17785 [Anaerolineae bacterium]|nr:hypothetical protein [Anaerolineae bacterium]